jgi:hypothetical protein
VQSKERTPTTSVEELRGNEMIPTGPQSVSIDVELPTGPYLYPGEQAEGKILSGEFPLTYH